jgi:hypothetical protein
MDSRIEALRKQSFTMSHKYGVILKRVESHCSGSDCSNDILSFLRGGVLVIMANRSIICLKVQFLFLFSPPTPAPALRRCHLGQWRVVVHKVHQGLSELSVLPVQSALLPRYTGERLQFRSLPKPDIVFQGGSFQQSILCWSHENTLELCTDSQIFIETKHKRLDGCLPHIYLFFWLKKITRVEC